MKALRRIVKMLNDYDEWLNEQEPTVVMMLVAISTLAIVWAFVFIMTLLPVAISNYVIIGLVISFIVLIILNGLVYLDNFE